MEAVKLSLNSLDLFVYVGLKNLPFFWSDMDRLSGSLEDRNPFS